MAGCWRSQLISGMESFPYLQPWGTPKKGECVGIHHPASLPPPTDTFKGQPLPQATTSCFSDRTDPACTQLVPKPASHLPRLPCPSPPVSAQLHPHAPPKNRCSSPTFGGFPGFGVAVPFIDEVVHVGLGEQPLLAALLQQQAHAVAAARERRAVSPRTELLSPQTVPQGRGTHELPSWPCTTPPRVLQGPEQLWVSHT